jgi:hypothetical protein
MYVSVTLSKTKKPRWFRKESPALKNPKIIRNEIFRWKSSNEHGEKIHESVKEPYLDGEKIIRTELKPSYVIKIGESYRQGGKVKSRQKHILTFDEWAVVDGLLESEKNGSEHFPGQYIDGYDFDTKVQKVFPDADLDVLWDLLQEKLRPREDSILAEFKKTEEYRWWLVTKKLKMELKAEKARAEKRQKQYEEKSRQYQQGNYQHYQQASNDMSTSSGGVSLSQEEIRVIDSCYRAMATQLHPDKGGDVEDMKILNGLKDKIRRKA